VIGSLRGRLRHKSPEELTLEVGGVGYRLFIPLSTFYALGEENGELELQVHTHVREDALQLFGFLTRAERELFERLIRVSGIGPRLAVAILSGMPPEELVPALQGRQVARLVTIPGVGRKTAERLVLELQEKVADLAPSGEAAPERPAEGGSEGAEEAVSALMNLGYREREARRAVEAAAGEGDLPLEGLLRASLRRLSR
jgi:Holliday junction DNA helicase RuvA